MEEKEEKTSLPLPGDSSPGKRKKYQREKYMIGSLSLAGGLIPRQKKKISKGKNI
ncbi:hypothetical protein [uncultured Parabacteroides sp.]|uniref:hypothetical protein n=1 Tax=uncultured Parabacteroides sp. TaxID=512312 RepID=UPI0026DD4DC7|nr:hypothetical protein [uncultured Parabacteroides sp.]